MKEFLGTVIGAIVGAVIGAIVSFSIMYFDVKFNFETDFQSSTIELESARENIDSMLNDKDLQVPIFKVLNMQLDWKEALLNYDDQNLNTLYNKLNRLDNLREIILQEDDKVMKAKLFEEHKQIMTEIAADKSIEIAIEFIKEHS
jgi:hypothetical protein